MVPAEDVSMTCAQHEAELQEAIERLRNAERENARLVADVRMLSRRIEAESQKSRDAARNQPKYTPTGHVAKTIYDAEWELLDSLNDQLRAILR
jgi:predicted metal-dependent hydrolase